MVGKIDLAYNTVERDDFLSMIDVERYGKRSHRFDEIIARTDEHFWNPDDDDYIRFDDSWRGEESIFPLNMVPEMHSAVGDKLDERQKIQFANESARWTLSQILHGEQGAFNLSVSLCELLLDPGAQEYASNQAREEARHVHAFANYMGARFGGRPLPVGNTLGSLLDDIVKSPLVYKKLVGMQMLVEGLAMGAFATLHVKAQDPLLRRLCQLVMTDEAFHHKFGKIWADTTMPGLPEQERHVVEDWALECFNRLLMNLVNSEQKQAIYPQFGLDWQWVRSAMLEAFTDTDRRRLMKESTNVFRTLIKTLIKANIITERTRTNYAAWVDMDELAGEGDRMVGDEIAEQGIAYLKEINAGKKRIVKKQVS
ncbi:MAG TPA: ferritin-like domain-containing protein [Candidatus Acidoferrales bacterium]|nr:ferritin-like domain-containing protein [Candidatus Acidoferrales bacterium]